MGSSKLLNASPEALPTSNTSRLLPISGPVISISTCYPLETARALIFVVASLCAGALLWGHRTRADRFLRAAFSQLRGGPGHGNVKVVKLESGETASVILEHSCCVGAGFDAVAIRMSDGREFAVKINYCGIEGFYGEVVSKASKNLEGLATLLESNGYKLQREVSHGGTATRR